MVETVLMILYGFGMFAFGVLVGCVVMGVIQQMKEPDHGIGFE